MNSQQHMPQISNSVLIGKRRADHDVQIDSEQAHVAVNASQDVRFSIFSL